MARASTKPKKDIMKTLCKDCISDFKVCKKDPLECKRKAQTYFKLYDKIQ